MVPGIASLDSFGIRHCKGLIHHISSHENIRYTAMTFLMLREKEFAKKIMDATESVCHELGVPLAAEKTLGSASKVFVLGIQLDLDLPTLSLPKGKYEGVLISLKL